MGVVVSDSNWKREGAKYLHRFDLPRSRKGVIHPPPPPLPKYHKLPFLSTLAEKEVG